MQSKKDEIKVSNIDIRLFTNEGKWFSIKKRTIQKFI